MIDHEPQTAAEEARYRVVADADVGKPDATEILLKALYDESWRVRKAAAERIPSLRNLQDAIPTLLQILGERGQTGARNAAAEALARMAPASTPALLELLQHADPDQRKFAADILAEARDPQSAPALVQALGDADRNVQLSVAEALAKVGGDEARRAIERLLGHSDPLLKLAALDGLASLRHAPPLPVLMPLLDDGALRRAAFRVLGLVREPAALERICRALSDARRGVREAALVALGVSARAGTTELEQALRATVKPSPELGAALKNALESEQAHLRLGALAVVGALREVSLARTVAEVARDDAMAAEVTATLERLGSAGARVLLSSMNELSAPARAVAAEALVPLSDPSLVAQLAELSENDEPELQLFAIKALGRSQSREAIPVLLRLLDSAASAAAGRALVALADPFHSEVLKVLQARVHDSATPAAVFALARVGGKAAEPHLQLTLKDPDPAVRAASAEAASAIGGRESQELLRLALTDEEAPVRAAAARSLGKLEGAAAEQLLVGALADPEASVQGAAIDAAADAGLQSLAAPISGALTSRNPYLASRAVRALARLGRFDARALDASVKNGDPEVLKEALAAGAGLSSAVATAVTLLGHARWDVRAAAGRLLGVSGSAEVVDTVSAALSRERDPYTRQVLDEAFEKLRRR
ncbi:MAG: HEAT repeat domain-containing protein [Myxococcaceae bacterium]